MADLELDFGEAAEGDVQAAALGDENHLEDGDHDAMDDEDQRFIATQVVVDEDEEAAEAAHVATQVVEDTQPPAELPADEKDDHTHDTHQEAPPLASEPTESEAANQLLDGMEAEALLQGEGAKEPALDLMMDSEMPSSQPGLPDALGLQSLPGEGDEAPSLGLQNMEDTEDTEAAPTAQDLLENADDDFGLEIDEDQAPAAEDGGLGQSQEGVAGSSAGEGAAANGSAGAGAAAAAAADSADAAAGASSADPAAPAAAATAAAPAGNQKAIQNLYNQLFGDDDDDEDGEFAGFNEPAAPVEKESKSAKRKAPKEAPVPRAPEPSDSIRDEFALLKKKARPTSRKRTKKDEDSIDLKIDETLDNLVKDMNIALEVDKRELMARRPALQRMQLLSRVSATLRQAEIISTAQERETNSVLENLGEWLKPINNSLPNNTLRNTIIALLPLYSKARKAVLEESKISDVCYYLLQHPQETADNKRILRQLCDEWHRIVGESRQQSREEPEAGESGEPQVRRNLQPTLMARRSSQEGVAAQRAAAEATARRALRPGDVGFINRARVPQSKPASYTIRPESNVKFDPSTSGKAALSTIEKRLLSRKF